MWTVLRRELRRGLHWGGLPGKRRTDPSTRHELLPKRLSPKGVLRISSWRFARSFSFSPALCVCVLFEVILSPSEWQWPAACQSSCENVEVESVRV